VKLVRFVFSDFAGMQFGLLTFLADGSRPTRLPGGLRVFLRTAGS
jgi:hypothetical protein